jgi:hypothetical protein
MSKLANKIFLTSGSWVAPPGVTSALIIGYGGGGAGGGGSPGSGTVNANSSTGGGGGGGSLLSWQIVNVVPGTTYVVTVGAGGNGATPTNPGANGSATSFDTLAVFSGAGGGASTTSSGAGTAFQAFGGTPVALNSAVTSAAYNGRTALNISPNGDSIQTPAGSGGRSINQAGNNVGAISFAGTPSAQGFAGGAGGSFGGTSTGVGGGGGGGGGGGPGGVGGAGGTGGNGSATVAVTSGTAGSAAAANTGGGGGGGGGGGTSTSGGASGSGGGSGGSGKLTISWIE